MAPVTTGDNNGPIEVTVAAADRSTRKAKMGGIAIAAAAAGSIRINPLGHEGLPRGLERFDLKPECYRNRIL
ncbi:hypothetical protein ES703_121164 [subsurface metagenome]